MGSRLDYHAALARSIMRESHRPVKVCSLTPPYAIKSW